MNKLIIITALFISACGVPTNYARQSIMPQASYVSVYTVYHGYPRPPLRFVSPINHHEYICRDDTCVATGY